MARAGVYSHLAVSRVWFVILAFFVALIFMSWKAVLAIEEIALNTTSMTTQMTDLMADGRTR